jgi:hypothetical protein
MTDRLDAIEAGLRDGRYDCRVPEDTDAVRWLVGEIKWMRDALGECYQLTGADPDGNENWRLAPHAIDEVRRLRADHDNTEAALTALRQRHAADVEAAFRAGYSAGGDDMSAAYHNEYYVGEDAAWLASEAKARLT